MTKKDLEILKGSPDYREIEFMGEKKPWLLSTLAFSRAEAQGVTMEELLDIGDGTGAENAMKLSRLVWAGFLTFDPDVSLELVQAGVSLKALPEVVKAIGSEGKAQAEATP